MARTTHVKAARKDQGTCESCGKPIEAGMSYKWVQPRAFRGARGTKRVRHEDCPSWRPSELSSSKMAAVMAAQESFDDEDFASAEDIVSGVESVAETVREVAEEYRESAQNIEDGFQHETYQSQELNEKADELEGWADELEGFEADDVECQECSYPEDEHHEYEQGEDGHCLVEGCPWNDKQQVEDEHHEYVEDLDTIRDNASELVNSCPV